ncbi:MAG: hypothetical protein FJ403_22155 [Verrucomicrobia bacterium]|nr:hypothetical protein [Verrucomicrobiota bacterium]
MTKTKPAHEVRFGAIKATIWENSVGEGTKFNVTFSRIYKDGEEWRSSESFGRDDLLLVAKVADEAHSWIHEQRPVKETPAPPQRFNNSPANA